MSVALPPIPSGTCIGDIATDMAVVLIPISAEMALRSKRLHGPQGWCANPGVQDDMKAAGKKRCEEKPLCSPNNGILREGVKKANNNHVKVRKAAVLSFLWTHFRQLGGCDWKGDQAGYNEHLKVINLGSESEACSSSRMRTVTC